MKKRTPNYLSGHFIGADSLIKYMNSKISYIETTSSVVIHETGEIIPVSAARMDASPLVVEVIEGENTKKYKGFDFWLRHPERHVISSQHMNDGQMIQGNSLNVFRGFGVESCENREAVEHTLEYLRYLCNSNDDKMNALLNILAWQVQNIGEPSRVIIIVKSEKQQVGKSNFFNEFMGEIYGDSSLVVTNMERLTSRFNTHLIGKAWICCEETGFAGSVRDADIIKSLVTSKKINVEVKNGGVFEAPFATNVCMLTNHDFGAHIEENDRRYFLINIDHIPSNDPFVNKWAEKAKAKNSIYPGAFLNFLQNRKLETNYRPYMSLDFSDDKSEFIKRSNPASFELCLQEDRIIPLRYILEKDGVRYVRNSYFVELYNNYAKGTIKRDSTKKINEILLKEKFGEKERITFNGIREYVRQMSPDWQVEPVALLFENTKVTSTAN